MEQKRIVNGVNQAGKAPQPDDERNRPTVKRRDNGFVALLMSVLSKFGEIVSPIKEEKDKQKRRR
jgi:hypothetical protein